MNRQNTIIVILCITATLLGSALLLMSKPSSALAGTSESRSGDYIMIPAAVSGSQDIVYVIDLTAQRLNAYALGRDDRDRQIYLVENATIDLEQSFAQAAAGRRTNQ